MATTNNNEGVWLPAPGGINLAMTLESGQVFHWQAQGAGFTGVIGRCGVYVEQRNDGLFCACDKADIVSHYFALDVDLEAIRATFPEDPVLREATCYCDGVRILRQPVWECLATFMTTIQKQVSHIRAISRALRSRYGDSVDGGFDGLFAYPAPAELAQAGEEALRACGLGYRAKFLARTAEIVASGGIDLEELKERGDSEVRAALCSLPGVGIKVANCVLLFAYGRLSSFPIDVWIERILRGIYLKKSRRKVTPQVMADFAARHFGTYGGYAQQYLFHHARCTWRNQHKLSGRKNLIR